ncbi:MAG: TraB/GumN family protein, partial [Flavobacterium sp.]
MKKLFIITTLLSTITLFAQKEKTLLWEISGNGLAKKSYVYGTMHVNDKISYYLSDSFFKYLLEADIVSTESDPETWDEMFGMTNPSELIAPHSFYTSFYLKPLKKKNLKVIFSNENYFSNMMSGVEGTQSDYQENTVLDMFIYQTGRKYKKKIVGLENAKTTMLNILKVNEQDAKPDDKNREPLMKLIKSGNFSETLNDYYREKDIIMLDSIYKLMFSKKFFGVMITDRNAIMTRSIDSLARKGSLFAAVGAAHLAGKTGIIQLLRDKGYTVSPVYDIISEKGQNQKKAIEEYFPHPTFEVGGTTDGMIRMPLNRKVIPSQDNIGSPDFTNGGAINIKRLPLNYFLNKETENFNPKTLDSLFYENIAGNILEKKYFQEENYSGYDIKNSTKNGNSQHWRFYITPLELITVSMTGMGNYTKQFEKEVFENLKIKGFSNS